MNYQLEVDNVAQWMQQYQENSGCKGFIIGISGGIDSALVASLICHKTGKDKIIALYLPCESSSNMEDDAIQLANNLGIEIRIFYLTNTYNTIIEEMEAGGEIVSRLTKANTKARLRMTMLFAMANQYNYLVAGTGNKSELDIGYVTVGGDQIVSIEPIGNYYKGEVYKMADCFPQIPDTIKVKKPSADLWTGQTDEDELGISYEKLDLILSIYPPYGTWNQMYFDSYKITKEEFNKVDTMIKKSQYKNEVPPRYIRQ